MQNTEIKPNERICEKCGRADNDDLNLILMRDTLEYIVAVCNKFGAKSTLAQEIKASAKQGLRYADGTVKQNERG